MKHLLNVLISFWVIGYLVCHGEKRKARGLE